MGLNTINEGRETKMKETREAAMDSKEQTCAVSPGSALSLKCCKSGMNCS
jgi:hypothetical protein